MISIISRKTFFQSSPFADIFIADMQSSYASLQNKRQLKEYFDHRNPLGSEIFSITGHCVLAYPAESRNDYIEGLPAGIVLFFKALAVETVHLLDFIDTGLSEFPFETFVKRNLFRRATRAVKPGYLLQFDRDSIPAILPLFFFSRRYDIPVIFLMSTGPVPLSLRLCDDGNLHLNFQEIHREQVLAAAACAGLVTGDIELCDEYSVNYLKQ